MFTEEEWQRFLEYFNILTMASNARGLTVQHSRERGVVEHIGRDGKTVVRTEDIRNILNVLPQPKSPPTARRLKDRKS
ncbi:MAG: hypothetical protein A3C84_03335 [Candidatus Ryanbacteria bacterium RIFCSPHIGHO2_02_FULL_48_12]|uniref:Uncharacterized protein n=1 Tax=Candidatus Ryanbacteria bacterium RIFCSPHIGHO2_01_FULL_48_27 TaxID=1802115 RepID=A0A1G2FYG2_9BACT|nr:MAG: hypothetical protein A2756_00050 [Candidatus Ryanbacteria bacterium RIFCSPHIGHO2_01_FULL_48_27]OGZ49966.1 MAG: hypothetical protein A3C84_03335 [Candidatus Ryanbacteria bacterium RIFCSPHIGHO2_02_FULL_48_12]